MSVVKKTIAFDEFFWNTYIDHGCDNLSQYIRKYIILGVEAEVNKTGEQRQRILELVREKDLLATENKLLKASLESLKSRSKKTESYETIVSKYGLNDQLINKLKIAAQKIHDNPAFFDGQFNLYKNETGLNMKRSHFDLLIKSFNQQRL